MKPEKFAPRAFICGLDRSDLVRCAPSLTVEARKNQLARTFANDRFWAHKGDLTIMRGGPMPGALVKFRPLQLPLFSPEPG